MASTLARGPPISESGEVESDGSSCEDNRDATLKRPHGDADSAAGKKRRKQSTPLRFPSSLVAEDRDEDDEEEDDEEEEDEESQEEEEEGAVRAALDGEGKTTVERIRRTSKDENLNNEFRCQYCSLLFDSEQTLDRHINSEHSVSRPAVQRSPVNPQIQVKQEFGQSQEQPECPVNLSGIGIKSFAATWLSGQVQSQSHQIQLQSQTDEWPPSGSAAAAASLSSISNHLQALPFPGALAQYLPMPNFSLASDTPGQTASRPPIGPAPMRIFNPDAYCDLCNKEFCNKYFLKTHKANKHGIYVDTPGQTVGESGFQASGYSGSFVSTGVKLEHQQQQPPPSQQQQQQHQQPAMKLEASAVPAVIHAPSVLNSLCDICQKRFKNEESLRRHKQKVHNVDNVDSADSLMLPPQTNEDERDTSHHSLSPGAMEALFKQEFGVEQEDTTFMPAPRHLSPQSVQQARDSGFNADRLRRLGVINPEAFCEICCKEYCNKYFLRTHKMKRHGVVVVQDNEKSPSNPGAAAAWHHVQTSPLNLIVGETSGNSSESGDRLGDDYECKPCGIRFQTMGLHQAHRRKIHETEEGASPKRENENDNGDRRRADSISEDLQKLQTMILQLNGLESGRAASCPICGKDSESRQSLRNHMTSEHGALLEDPVTPPVQANEKSPPPSGGGPLNCAFCDKEFFGQETLRKHVNEDHQPSAPTSAPLPSATLPTPATSLTPSAPPAAAAAPQNQERRTSSVSMTPTSSYCEICNKELCNKYFMKTHMQRMHGIEIENGAQIGGVICNICNKELCSKYFLRVHKHNTHGIIEEGSAPTGTAKQADNEANHQAAEDPALKPEQLGDLSHRYFTHFTEVCPICSRRFRSTKWLKAHLLSDHGKIGIDKWRELEQQYQSGPRGGRTPGPSRGPHPQNPNLKIPNGIEMAAQHLKSGDYAGLGNQVLSTLFGSAEDQQMKSYRCSYCAFTTPVLAFLFVHERSHTSPQSSGSAIEAERTLQCPVCLQGFSQPELLQHHLLTQHQFPGLIPPFQPHLVNTSRPESSSEKDSESKDRTDLDSRDDTTKRSSPQTSGGASFNDLQKIQRPEDATAVQVTPQGAYKCAQCGYATANLNRIKKHIRKDHRTIAAGDPSETAIGELTRTLKDVSNKHRIPASYAMPQDMNSNPEKTIMQPFLIEECGEIIHGSSESNAEKKFAPALVYLPVKTRINAPLTASFNLSPA